MSKKVIFFISVILSIMMLLCHEATVNANKLYQKVLEEVNNTINKLLKQNNEKIKQPNIIDALVITGAKDTRNNNVRFRELFLDFKWVCII